MRLVNPVDRAFYYVRDDGSVCCGKLHGTRKAADVCAGKPPAPPKRTRAWTRRERDDADEDPRAEEREADVRRALRIDDGGGEQEGEGS